MYSLLRLLCIFIVACNITYAQNPEWVNYNKASTVNTIAEDVQYLWAGTNGGLVRIEKATSQIHFYNLSAKGILVNGINCIAIDNDGIKWLGTDNQGLVRLDGENITVYNSSNTKLSYNQIKAIAIDSKGNKWMTSGYNLVKFDGALVTEYFPSLNVLNSIALDASGSVWVGSISGLAKFDGTQWTHFDLINTYSEYKSNYVTDVKADKLGNIWATTNTYEGVEGGIFKYDGSWNYFRINSGLDLTSICSTETGDMVFYGEGEYVVYTNGIQSSVHQTQKWLQKLFFDKTGNRWQATNEGLEKIQGDSTLHFVISFSPIENNIVNDIAIDSAGTAWMATYSDYFDIGTLSFLEKGIWKYFAGGNSPLPGSNILSIAIDSIGNKWLGVENTVIKIGQYEWTNYYSDTKNNLPERLTSIKFDKKGNTWVCAGIGGVAKYDGSTWTFFSSQDNPVGAIEIDGNDNVWAATYNGLSMYDGSSWKFIGGSSCGQGSMAIDKNGNKWIANGNSLEKYDGVKFTKFTMVGNGISLQGANAINIDKDGNIWVGINNYGLLKYDGTVWTNYTPLNSGMTGTLVFSIKIDKNNNKWIATDNGVVIFREGGVDIPISTSPQVKSHLAAIAPKVAEVVPACTYKTLTFYNNGNEFYGAIDYSIDNGKSWMPIIKDYLFQGTGNGVLKLAWQVPAVNSKDCFMRITDRNDPSVTAMNMAPFSINYTGSSSVKWQFPTSLDTLKTGNKTLITWSSTTDIKTVDLSYSLDGGYTWAGIATAVPNNGNYLWVVSENPSPDYIFKINDHSAACVQDFTKKIVVVPSPYLMVKEPAPRATISAGASVYISWSSGILAPQFVNLDYSADSGLTWKNIETKVENKGNFNWLVPQNPSEKCMVRVSDYDNPNLSDASDNTFTISNFSISVQTPTPEENILLCSNYNITWTNVGNQDYFNILYSADSGVHWIPIALTYSTEIIKTYNWVFPEQLPAGRYMVKVEDYATKSIFGVSKIFNLKKNSPYALTYPKGGEKFIPGSIQTILWDMNGTANVSELSYSTDSGKTWESIGVADLKGRFDWSVPMILASKVLIKINDSPLTCRADTTDHYFSIASPKVWPGDVDNNTKVDIYDLLPLGYYLGRKGLARDSMDITWKGHTASDWGQVQSNQFDIKFADCNGDGIISVEDTTAIYANYGKNQNIAHLRIGMENIFQVESPLSIIIPDRAYGPGDEVKAEIYAGSSGFSMTNICGLAFKISVSSQAIVENSVQLNFTDSWLANSQISLHMAKYNFNSIDGAIVRMDKSGKSGFGKIADLKFTIDKNYTGKDLYLAASSNNIITSEGIIQAMKSGSDTVHVLTSISSSNNAEKAMHLSIYPNPNDGSFTISGNFPINEDLKTEITNIYGELVLPTKEMMTANGLELQIDPFLKGVYFLKVYDSDYIFTQKLIVR